MELKCPHALSLYPDGQSLHFRVKVIDAAAAKTQVLGFLEASYLPEGEVSKAPIDVSSI